MLKNLKATLIVLLSFTAMSEAKTYATEFNTNIVGGEVVTDRSSAVYKHTVRLLIEAKFAVDAAVPKDIQGKTTGWRCSAVAISNTWLLTAAHCLPNAISIRYNNDIISVPLENMTVEAFFKLNPREDRIRGLLHKSIYRHPGFDDNWLSRIENVWNPETPINDIALVELSRPIPNEKSPVEIADLDPDEVITLAGYGKTLSPNPFAMPELRATNVPFIEELQNGNEAYLGLGDPLSPRAVTGPKGGCSGDSGGPAYTIDNDGKAELVGLIVRGPDDASGGCAASISIITLVEPYLSWISQYVDFR